MDLVIRPVPTMFGQIRSGPNEQPISAEDRFEGRVITQRHTERAEGPKEEEKKQKQPWLLRPCYPQLFSAAPLPVVVCFACNNVTMQAEFVGGNL